MSYTTSSWENQGVNKSSILDNEDDKFQKRNSQWFPNGTGLDKFTSRSKYATIGRPMKPYGGKTKGKKKTKGRKYKSRKNKRNRK